MRIYLHNQPWTTTNTLASFNNARVGAPQWLRGTYHPMGNGYELRVQLVARGKAMIVTRPMGTKKQASTLAVPIMGEYMPTDIEIDDNGTPTWNMEGVVQRLLNEFGLNPQQIHMLSEGVRFEVSRWRMRELRCNSEATRTDQVPSLKGDTLVDAIDRASWVISMPGEKADESNPNPEVMVWTHLWKQADQQNELWAALQQIARKVA